MTCAMHGRCDMLHGHGIFGGIVGDIIHRRGIWSLHFMRFHAHVYPLMISRHHEAEDSSVGVQGCCTVLNCTVYSGVQLPELDSCVLLQVYCLV
jgi:hypothetical protein